MDWDAVETSSTGDTSSTEHHFYHDMGGPACLSSAILSALADVRGVDVTALDLNLYDHVDPDALDAILAPRLDGTPREGGRVELILDGLAVDVSAGGHIVVRDAGTARPV